MRIFILGLTIFSLAGCNSKPDTLFTLLDKSDTGVDFQNQIFEDDKVNILELEYVYNGGGVSVADFNNDGLTDLFFTGNMVSNKMFLNKGDFEFEDISENAGIGGFFKWKSGSAVVDINGDGWLDIYVCATISADSAQRKNMMLINQGINDKGNLTFKDQARSYGIDYAGFSSNAGFFDADADGDLDLYILTNSKQPGIPVTWRPKINDGSSTNTDKLFRNNGNGTFTDVSFESGIINEGYGLGLSFLDVNQDGHTDVYVGNDYITNDLLYVNQGNGKFVNEIDRYMKHQSKFSMGNDVADINNDGHPDIMTVDMLPETNFRKKTVVSGSGYITYINDLKYGYTHQYIRNMLQLNNGDGTFSEIGQLAGIHQTEWSWSPLFADFDNDGFRDLIVTNGFPRDVTDRDFISFREKTHGLATREALLEQVPSVKIPNNAFRNKGDLTFAEVTKEWGFDTPTFSSGAAYADLDNDGDLDYIVNNINDPVSIYRNNLYAKKEARSNHYLRLKLEGDATNSRALGSKVTLYQKPGKIQYAEQAIYRGYISTVEDVIHFGLGAETTIDSLVIKWPNGLISKYEAPKPDQLIVANYKDAKTVNRIETPALNTLFQEQANLLKPDFIHQEGDKIDFNIQRTLPHKLSQTGPGLAVGDVNGDGREDFILGGASNFSTTLFLQSANGTFGQSKIIGKADKLNEDTGLLLFDADNDADLDLYCVSGSYEFQAGSPHYQDRLFINDGKGNFKLTGSQLPSTGSSGSCVRAADFDADGDLDLFVGGRTPPASYPLPDSSYILVNNKGTFENMTQAIAPELALIGMVTDALWTDFDNDGKVDLAIVGEFMAPTFFKNNGKQLLRISNTGVDDKVGWYNSITGGDFDNDGDTDYVVGNLGLNNFYRVKENQPLTVCAKDFDGNGSIDAILSCYAKAKTGELAAYPIHFWDELNSQSPKFRQRYNHFREFAEVTTDKFFSPEELKGSLNLSANYMATSIIMNLGGNKFAITALPQIVQIAPVNGIVVDDMNDDGNLDIGMVGNDYGNEPTYGQYDAFTGVVLSGNGIGGMTVVPLSQTGFRVNGDAKAFVKIQVNGQPMLLASQNRDRLKLFKKSTNDNKIFKPEPDDAAAIITRIDGSKQRIEFYFGAGYLSQSTRQVSIPKNVTSIEVINFAGSKRTVTLR